MKLGQLSKRIVLFFAVNLLVVLTLSLVMQLLGVPRHLGSRNYQGLLIFCLIWGMGGAFISLAMSRLMAKWMMGVQVIPPNASDPGARQLVQMVHQLAQRAGLPAMPEVGVYDSPEVNAFATGPTRSRALVAVSSGLLRNMNGREVTGVLAHEIAHIANGDMVTMTLIQGIINAFVMFLARILAMLVSSALRSRENGRGGYGMHYLLVFVFELVLSLLGFIVVCWFSRWREFRADAGGARYGGIENMIGALRSLQDAMSAQAIRQMPGRGNDAFQTLKISSPGMGWAGLFRTHPPLEERIARLEQMRQSA
jgi:heat shock protein HtpX